MQDLTTGSVTRHLLQTTSFMLVTMVFQTLYFLVDLYWVGRLGKESVAAVAVSGNLTFIVLALSQMLGVGATTVVSHAAGRKERDRAVLLFNQSQVLSLLAGVVFLAAGMLLRNPYANALSADRTTASLASDYLLWFIPAMALQFPLVSMGSLAYPPADVGKFEVVGGLFGEPLQVAACATIERHCADCASCAAVVDGLKQTAGLCRQLGTTPLPLPVLERARASVRRLLENSTTGDE